MLTVTALDLLNHQGRLVDGRIWKVDSDAITAALQSLEPRSDPPLERLKRTGPALNALRRKVPTISPSKLIIGSPPDFLFRKSEPTVLRQRLLYHCDDATYVLRCCVELFGNAAVRFLVRY